MLGWEVRSPGRGSTKQLLINEHMATYHLRQDNSKGYYWILKSDKNGETVVRSSESYTSKQNAEYSISWNRANAKEAGYEDHTK